jgi:AcrR family transcriptional regulator
MRGHDEAPSRPGTSEDGEVGGAGTAHDARTLSRKDRERGMHRDQILAAARNLLGKKPYTEITVQEIAADAEFSVGYIYKIFESKEDIYVTLIRDQGDHFLRIVEREVGAAGGFEERLANMVHGVFDWLDSNPFTTTHMNETHCPAHALPRLAAVHAEREERLQEMACGFFREGLQAGVIQGDLDIMMRTLRALIWGFIGEDLFHGTRSRKWTEYAPVVVQVFMRAFAPEGGLR